MHNCLVLLFKALIIIILKTNPRIISLFYRVTIQVIFTTINHPNVYMKGVMVTMPKTQPMGVMSHQPPTSPKQCPNPLHANQTHPGSLTLQNSRDIQIDLHIQQILFLVLQAFLVQVIWCLWSITQQRLVVVQHSGVLWVRVRILLQWPILV